MSSIRMDREAEPVAGAAGDAGSLCALIEDVRTADRAMARAVVSAARLAGGDRRMLVNAGETLRNLLAGLFCDTSAATIIPTTWSCCRVATTPWSTVTAGG